MWEGVVRLVRAGWYDGGMSKLVHSSPALAAIQLRGLGRGRVVAGSVLAVVLPVVVQGLLMAVWEANLATASLVQLTGAVAVALVGGIVPGLLAALWSSLLLNYFMVDPTGSLLIHDAATVVSLVCFVVVSGAVAVVVDASARRLAQARRAGAEAAVLNRLAMVVVAAEDPVLSLLEQAREVFALGGVALFARSESVRSGSGDGPRWELWGAAGQAPATPGDGQVETVDERTLLVLGGRELSAGERKLLKAFTAQIIAVRDRQQLVVSRRENQVLAQDNKMRTSILQAVSHDLRTPLAGIRLAVSSLLSPQARFGPAQQRELLETTQDYAEQLEVMVENLLDMSRITGQAVGAVLGPLQWQDVLPGALRSVPADAVDLEVAASAPAVIADAGLLERVIANLAENAARHAPDSRITLVARDPVEADWASMGELRVVDTGSQPVPEDLEELFVPFQRFDDTGGLPGVGLGLAVARGLAEAMGGTLHAERTPGGGLTMVLRLPTAAVQPSGPVQEAGR